MKTYKVIKKEGVRSASGKLIKEGETFTGSHRSATIQLQLRCKEIEEISADKGEDSDGPSKKPEYIEALKALGVEPPEGAKVADLKALYEEATKSEDEE